MEFLIALIHGTEVYMCAPKSESGFSHIVSKRPALFGCINDKKTQFSLHTTPPSVNKDVSFNGIKSNIIPNLPDGTYDIFLATNTIIYHIDHEGTVMVSTSYKAIGYKSDIMIGALFATKRLEMSPEDRLKIAMEAASINEYEIIRI